MINWKEDTDYSDNRRIYHEDMICDWCEEFGIPMAHDEGGKVYCGKCLEKMAKYIRMLGRGMLVAGDEVIFDLNGGVDSIYSTLKEWRQAQEERLAYAVENKILWKYNSKNGKYTCK